MFTLIAPELDLGQSLCGRSVGWRPWVGQPAFVRLRSEPNSRFETEIVRIDQENDRLTEERRVYVRCRICNPQHQLRYLGEQAEIEIVKKTIPERPVRAAQIHRRI